MIEALIFDFDGLILDTESSSLQTWQEIYTEFGCDLPFETWGKSIGGSATEPFDACEYLEMLLGRPVEREELRERRRKRHVELVEALLPLPGVEDYLREAKRLGLKIGLASSSRHEWVDAHLARLDLLAYFDTIKCRNDVAHVKPDPALYLAVLDALHVGAEQAIVFEDSPNGVVAAQRAGIFSIAVPNLITCQLSLEHADMRLISMRDMPLEALLAAVQEKMLEKA
jgi:HAD superfamily hydrolase (TIGR01509 family)